ncbi:acyl carrier protein, partial [Streptomyces sp. S6]
HRLAVVGATPRDLAEALANWRARSTVTAAAQEPPRRITLHTEGPAEELDAVAAALADAFPGLADTPAATVQDMLARLGVAVSPAEGGPGPDVRLDLSWEADGRRTTLPLAGARPQDAPGLLRAALAGLFTAGADLRLAALAAPGTRFAPDLPTYPFRRRRYWIDEPAGEPSRGPGAETPADGALPESLEPEALTCYLLDLLRDVLQADTLDPELSLLDVGVDSFLSTLFITRIEERFEVGLTADGLSLDMPLHDLLGKLAESIAATAAAGQGVGA